ncbi:UpxY family transcription antiterminator [Leptospira sp. 'Mane']|uniref:UpxY family transcription antiterminator n=1 Tax=Leptospira sp. 'Mane' TaxID=3387407 RepID=UPI00398B6B3F
MHENDPLNIKKQWFALYTNPRAEKSLSRLFKKYKIDHYLPLLKERKKWSDRFKIIETPRLKSYIFVNIVFWKDKVSVLQLPGAHHFVFAKGVPAVLEDEKMEELKSLVENYGDQMEVMKNEALQPGKLVKIKEGPFLGKTMEIIKRKNAVTLILRLPDINQVFTAEMSIDKISWEEIDT